MNSLYIPLFFYNKIVSKVVKYIFTRHDTSEEEEFSHPVELMLDFIKVSNFFITENNFQSGNPALRAAISNQFNLNYTFKNKYSFDFYYRDNGQNVAQLVFQDNENLFPLKGWLKIVLSLLLNRSPHYR